MGSYLSGGMDSGSITCIAAQSFRNLKTFTGGFDLSSASGLELGFDERAKAEFLSSRYKTEHYEVILKAGDMERVMPQLIWHMEDLRVGQSYPNFYVARLASKFVKVVLSGAGGTNSSRATLGATTGPWSTTTRSTMRTSTTATGCASSPTA